MLGARLVWVRASRLRECVLASTNAQRGWLPPRRAQQRVRNPRLRIAVSVTRQRSLSVWYEPCRDMVVSFLVTILRRGDLLSRLSFFRTTHGHGGTLCTRVRECRLSHTG